jgi:Tfp pilus assembly protein PilN
MPAPAREDHDVLVRARLRPLLFVGAAAVELVWLADGHARHEQRAVESQRADLIAAAARELVASGPGRRARVVLCLDEHAFETQQLVLGSLPEHEVPGVLARRAANLLETPLEESLYVAQRLCPPFESEAANADSNWLLHARKRRDHEQLLLALRAAGVHVERVVAVRDVLPHAAGDAHTGGEVLIAYDGTTVSTHLVRAGALVQHSRLRLAADMPAKDSNVAIVQEVRQVSAFWSKSSRGAPIETVRVLGLPEEQLEEMSTPLSIAALGATIVRVGSSPDRSPQSVRRAFLMNVARLAGSARDLSLRLPPRRSRVVLAALGATAAAAVLGLSQAMHWDQRVDERRSAIAALSERSTDLDAVQSTTEAYERARADLAVAVQSLASVPGRGLPFEQVLERVRTEFGPRVRLQHIAVAPGTSGPVLLVEGAIEGELDAAARELNRLRGSLQEAVWLRRADLAPSSRVPDGEETVGLSFTLEAECSEAVR